jgi:hypothetical protein
MSQTWKYNNVELEFDMGDVDTLETYENAFVQMEVTQGKLPKTGTHSEMTRAYCEMFLELFDNLFEEGTGKKLMGERLNVREAEKCYHSFLVFVKRQMSEMNHLRQQTLSLNQPKRKGNR